MKKQKLLLTHYKEKDAAFLLEENVLIQAFFESMSEYAIGDVFVGRVKNIIKGIDAAFVEYAPKTVGFLPLTGLKTRNILNRSNAEYLKNGDEVLVQICKEPLKTKDATLTTDISFSGKYMVLIPLSHGIHYSKKLSTEQKIFLRELITSVVSDLFGDIDVFLQRYGMIIRTDAAGADYESLSRELHELFHKASEIITVADKRTLFSCLHQEDALFIKVTKDHFHNGFTEVITDDEHVFRYFKSGDIEMTGLKESIKYYKDSAYSLEKLYSLETQLQHALAKKVWLKSGGYLIIEPTEALTVIDVNSGKSSQSQNKMPREDFYHKINTEAVTEVAKQLRLRNISGIIIVDFLKTNVEHMDETLTFLKNEVRNDPVETVIIGVTNLGLVEITRKKTEASLYEKIGRFIYSEI